MGKSLQLRLANLAEVRLRLRHGRIREKGGGLVVRCAVACYLYIPLLNTDTFTLCNMCLYTDMFV
jgi:hypothetical protein